MQGWILGIADDLTGALETGARFAEYGFPTVVTTRVSIDAEPAAGTVRVIDTESRHLAEVDAVGVVRAAAESARRYAPWLVYKKTDSTLRGHIAAELGALHQLRPERGIQFQGAYPALGRTVCQGRLLVDGVEVHRTAAALDALNPVRSCDLGELLRGLPVALDDGESDDDVTRSAATLLLGPAPLPIAAGPAAFAGAIAAHLRAGGKAAREAPPRLGRVLVVNGSRHPASAGQIEHARARGLFDDVWSLLRPPSGPNHAQETAAAVRRCVAAHSVDALVVFGGDTAHAIHKCIDAAAEFEPWGELLTGVPLSRSAGLYWITKAGGFGTPEILSEIRKRIT